MGAARRRRGLAASLWRPCEPFGVGSFKMAVIEVVPVVSLGPTAIAGLRKTCWTWQISGEPMTGRAGLEARKKNATRSRLVAISSQRGAAMSTF